MRTKSAQYQARCFFCSDWDDGNIPYEMITCAEMQNLEKAVFQTEVSAEDLMEKVGRRMARVLLRDYPEPGEAIAFLGKGHNAGDALVVLRYLQEAGWDVSVRSASSETEMATLTRKKLRAVNLDQPRALVRRGPLLLLDGLLGIGSEGELREPLASLAHEMNTLRLTSGARTIAMDLPSGLNADTGEGGAVIADHTLIVGIPKSGLVADDATDFVGRLSLIELEELALPQDGDQLTTAKNLREHFPPRPCSFHKGLAGRVAIIAGSPGLLGAAALASTGALRAGAGLITLWVEPGMVHDILPLVPPEVMVRTRGEYDWSEILETNPDALVIGPGLGKALDTATKLFELMTESQLPTVLDADGLNLVVLHRRHDLLTENILLTPHPGEMKRIHYSAGSRANRARNFVNHYPATLLYKGARSIITKEGEPIYYNTTGTPGMATGGQGDLLSGIIGAFLAGGMDLLNAARAGAWLAARAAELAQVSEESLTPSDVADYLGEAFADLRK